MGEMLVLDSKTTVVKKFGLTLLSTISVLPTHAHHVSGGVTHWTVTYVEGDALNLVDGKLLQPDQM